MISIIRVNSTEGSPSVGVVLSAAAMFTTEDGNPLPGVALSPANARQAAYLMLYHAQTIECEAMARAAQPQPDPSPEPGESR